MGSFSCRQKTSKEKSVLNLKKCYVNFFLIEKARVVFLLFAELINAFPSLLAG